MDSDPRLVVFFIILSTNPKMLQMMNILVTVTTLSRQNSIFESFHLKGRKGGSSKGTMSRVPRKSTATIKLEYKT